MVILERNEMIAVRYAVDNAPYIYILTHNGTRSYPIPQQKIPHGHAFFVFHLNVYRIDEAAGGGDGQLAVFCYADRSR